MKKSTFTLFSLISFLSLIFAQGLHAAANAVIWTATGLPPGTSISSAGVITGKPTVAGTYHVTLTPTAGTALGNMSSITINVLPAGATLPNYYAYNRVLPGGGTINYQGGLAGGNGFMICQAQDGSLPLFSSSGVSFTTPSTPPDTSFFNISSMNGRNYYSTLQSSAAIAGSTALVLGTDASGNQAIFTSYNQGAFYPNTAPGDVYFNSGYGTVIGSDGASTFYCAIADGNGNLDLWSSPNKPLNWTQLGQYSLTYPGNLTSISVGKKGNTIVVAVASQGGGQQGVLVYSTDNGATFTQNTADSGIASVAFGNGIFLGSGANGLWSSQDGAVWTNVSDTTPGQLIYSAKEKLFFSSMGGVSKDGKYWQGYLYGGLPYAAPLSNLNFDTPIVSAGNGVIYLGNQQLQTALIVAQSQGYTQPLTVGVSANLKVVYP